MNSDLVPPQDLAAEESVLGAILVSPKTIDKVNEILDGTEFYRDSHALIFQAMIAMTNADEPIDVTTLSAYMEKKKTLESIGTVRLHELAALVPSAANVAHYAKIVRACSIRRKIIKAGMEISDLGWRGTDDVSDLVSQAQEHAFELGGRNDDSASFAEAAEQVYRDLEAQAADPKDLLGLTTSIRGLDLITRGLRKQALYIIAATTGMGKSALATKIVVNLMLKRNVPIAFFSMEMGRTEIILRMISLVTGIDHDRLTRSQIFPGEWQKIHKAVNDLVSAPFHLETNATMTPNAMRSTLRKLAAKPAGLGLVVVDYLQLLTPNKSSDQRTRDVAEIARSLKQIAMSLDVPVVALAQLNRNVDQRLNQRPMLSDLKESGEIEQASDCVFFIWKDPEEDEGVRQILIAKNRHGERDRAVRVAWVGSKMRFADLDEGARFA